MQAWKKRIAYIKKNVYLCIPNDDVAVGKKRKEFK